MASPAFFNTMAHNILALMDASKKGDLKRVEKLAKKKAIRAVHQGYTALLLASMYGRLEVVKLLCHEGADVNAKDMFGNTPLAFAAADGNMEMMTVLCDWGADLHSRDDMESSALVTAMKNEEYDAVKLLYSWG